MSKVLIGVMSCIPDAQNGSHDTIRRTWAAHMVPGLDYKIFMGQGTRDLAPDEVQLDAPDGPWTQGLCEKSQAMKKWALEHGYDGMLKLDSDTYVSPKRFMSSGFEKYDYIGYFPYIPDGTGPGFRHHLLQGLDRPLEERHFPGLAPFLELDAEFLVFGSFLFSAGGHFQELVRVRFHFDAADVEHDDGRLDAGGEFDGFDRVTLGQLTLAGAFVRKLVQVRRGMVDSHGQRAEIVDAGNLDFPGVHGVEDPGHETDARAVAQFGVFESEFTDLAQHRPAVDVAV